MPGTAKERPIMAWCETCEMPFSPGRFGMGRFALGTGGHEVTVGHLRLGRVVSLEGGTAECPTCGNMGRIQDGLYDIVLGVVRQSEKVFRSFTPEEAVTLVAALRKRQQNQVDDNAVIAAAPPAARKWIEDTLKILIKREILIPILISVLIAMFSQYMVDSSTRQIESTTQRSSTSTQEQIKKLDNQVEQLNKLVKGLLRQVEQEDGRPIGSKIPPSRAQPPAASNEPPDTMPNRNAPCWCGSGRKFKRCHRGYNEALNK
jgi:SEC-C motif